MKIKDIITEGAETYQPPALAVGDKILKGKFKNSPAEIKGFKTDKNNQPVLKTNKGEVPLFKPRIAKLMPKDVAEAIDQKDANEVYNALIADGDNLTARYFQQTRNSPKYNNIDSAMRAAERMASAEERKQAVRQRASTAVTTKPQPTSNKLTVAPKQSIRDPEDYSDNFYGNRYTGSLGKGASLGDVDLGINFNQSGLKTIGKTIGAVKAAAKPFSNLATAFKAGMSKAPSKR